MEEATFQQQVLEEILRGNTGSRRAALAGIAAIVQCTGSFRTGLPGVYRLFLRSERPEPLIKFFTLIRKTFNISLESGLEEPGKLYSQEDLPHDSGGYTCTVDGVLAGRIAEALFMVRHDGTIEPCGGAVDMRLLADGKCVRSFLAQQFLCIGSIRDPGKEYYLSFEIISGDQGVQTVRLLRDAGMQFRVSDRGRSRVIVTRDSSVIVDALNFMGAHTGMMDLENTRIRKQFRGKINREVNCETANIQKTVAASAKQVREIRELRNSSVWDTLPDSLREVALLREEYPESSLQELGSMLNPPVGKSGVNHRLRRLSALAGEIKGNSTDGQK